MLKAKLTDLAWDLLSRPADRSGELGDTGTAASVGGFLTSLKYGVALLSSSGFGRITLFLTCDVIRGRSMADGVFYSVTTPCLACDAVVTFYVKKPFPVCAICGRSPQERLLA